MNDSNQAVIPPENNNYLLISIWVGLLLAVVIAGFIYFMGNKSSTSLATDTVVNDAGESQKTALTNTNNNAGALSLNVESISSIETLTSPFQINDIKRYTIPIGEGMEYELTLADYMADKANKSAIVYLPAEKDEDGKVINKEKIPANFRYEKWLAASETLTKYTNEDSLFVSFWDNAQRIHFFTGRDNWVTLPAKAAYAEEEQSLWQVIAGGFDQQGHSDRFSQILLMDFDEALSELKAVLPQGRDHYLLLSTDDLSHVQEIARLTGRGLPLETRLFPSDADLHNSISQVKEWAQEGEGTGSYLAQSISERTIRVWRITDESFENTLFARLLPFSSSLDSPFEGAKLVYQSDWGGYISVYHLTD